MSLPSHISTEGAELAYVVANTPLYLIKRLQADPGVRLVSQSMQANELAAEYRSAVTQSPTNIRELITPYICLVALSMKDDISPLREETAIANPLPDYRWIERIRQLLIERYRPVSRSVINVPAIGAHPVQNTSSASTRHFILNT
jgi:hypothetical protein